MTLRSVVLGLLLGLVVSVATYFNDWVIGQTQFIGNHLPISVFGTAVALLLVLNPLLRSVGKGLMLQGGEIAVITAIGLAACGWPGSNFYRGFTTVSALPSHWAKTQADWQSANVFSYVPGASAEIGQGHVQDFRAVTKALIQAHETGNPPSVLRVWRTLSPANQRLVVEAAKGDDDSARYQALTRALNEAVRSAELYDQAAFQGLNLAPEASSLLARQAGGLKLERHETELVNRHLLVSAFPGLILPPPQGSGVLLDGGRADPFVVDTLLQGRSRANQLRLVDLPWAVWLPTILLWGGVAMALAIAAICLALIVHPQWSKRELLPYPLARFVEEAAERRPGSILPEVARSKLFWVGFIALASLHLLNGLHAWFVDIPEIPRNFNLYPLEVLFPNARRAPGAWGIFGPTMYFSDIAFSFFMTTSVSFSLGIASILWLSLGAVLIGNGYSMESDMLGSKMTNMMRFGGYLGIATIIVYTGRRYYGNVVTSMLGAKRAEETPSYAVWAARVLAVAAIIAVFVLKSAGLSVFFGSLFVLLVLLLFLVMARISTETGAFFLQAWWSPVGVITALIGFEAVGPTTFIILAVASVMLVIDPREALMPYVANGLRLAERSAGAAPARFSPWVVAIVVIGFFAAGGVTLFLQYNHGASPVGNDWALKSLPTLAFTEFSQHLAKSAAEGTLAQSTALGGWESLSFVNSGKGALPWTALGIALVVGAAVARLRLPWWPLHPVAFLVWGTYPIIMFGPSFLMGWLVKAGVVGTTGAKGYHALKPLMIGVIAGELLTGLFWMIVGAAYFFVTGKTPVTYSIFPG